MRQTSNPKGRALLIPSRGFRRPGAKQEVAIYRDGLSVFLQHPRQPLRSLTRRGSPHPRHTPPPRPGLPGQGRPALSAPPGGATCLRGRGLGGAAGQGLPGLRRPAVAQPPGSCRDGERRTPGTAGGGGTSSGRGVGGRQGGCRSGRRRLRVSRSPAPPRPAGALTASPGPGWGRAHRPPRPRSKCPDGAAPTSRNRFLPRCRGFPAPTAAATGAEPQGGGVRGPSAAGAVPPPVAGGCPGSSPRRRFLLPPSPHHRDDRRGVGRGACREGSGVPRPGSLTGRSAAAPSREGARGPPPCRQGAAPASGASWRATRASSRSSSRVSVRRGEGPGSRRRAGGGALRGRSPAGGCGCETGPARRIQRGAARLPDEGRGAPVG